MENAKLLDFTAIKPRLSRITQDWASYETEVATARRTRYIDVSVESLRATGELESDDILIPRRVIDSNIAREMPSFIGYLTQTRRLVLFKDVEDPSVNTYMLEKEVTDMLRYNGWQIPHYKVLDGSKTFGWDFVEIEYDTTKPGHVGIDHIGNDKLIFPMGAKNIQACDILLRKFEVTKLQLESFVTNNGFDKAQVDKIFEKHNIKDPTNANLNPVVCIYKKWCKYNGIVYVSWLSLDTDDWLRKPEPLWLGVSELTVEPVETQLQVQGELPLGIEVPQQVWKEVYETEYPIEMLIYRITEQDRIIENKGRVFLDSPDQEAQTALMSSMVSGAMRSCNIYGAPKQADPSGAAIKQTEIKLQHGSLYNNPIDFFTTPFPNPAILETAQRLSVINQQENGMVDFAVNNRQDSRKTATEIQAATTQANMISGVQVSLYSAFLRSVFIRCWRIIQSQAIQGKIPLLRTLGPDGQVTNNIAVIQRQYQVRPAGDVEIVERAEMLQGIQTVMPLVQGTALAQEMLLDMIKMMFPEQAARYENILRNDYEAKNKQQILGMFEVIKGIVLDDSGKSIRPEFANMAPMFQQLTQSVAARYPEVASL